MELKDDRLAPELLLLDSRRSAPYLCALLSWGNGYPVVRDEGEIGLSTLSNDRRDADEDMIQQRVFLVGKAKTCGALHSFVIRY